MGCGCALSRRVCLEAEAAVAWLLKLGVCLVYAGMSLGGRLSDAVASDPPRVDLLLVMGVSVLLLLTNLGFSLYVLVYRHRFPDSLSSGVVIVSSIFLIYMITMNFVYSSRVHCLARNGTQRACETQETMHLTWLALYMLRCVCMPVLACAGLAPAP